MEKLTPYRAVQASRPPLEPSSAPLPSPRAPALKGGHHAYRHMAQVHRVRVNRRTYVQDLFRMGVFRVHVHHHRVGSN